MNPNIATETLFDYAVAHPDGFSKYDFANEHNLSMDQVNGAIRRLRRILADDTITLICEQGEAQKPWTYRLVGNVDESSPWVRNRLTDAETRFVTLSSVARALVNATDGRTIEGRRARAIHKACVRAKEDLDDLSQEVETWTA